MEQLDQMRREAVQRLCEAQVEGRLSIAQFEERYALVARAESTGAMLSVVADLEPMPPGQVEDDFLPSSPPVRLPTVLGSTKRSGTWNVPEEMHCLVILGELVLDFRDAHFSADHVTIDLSATLASVTLIVTPGTQVENECREVMSSTTYPKRRRRRRVDPNGLLIVVTGKVVLSELGIKEKEPTAQ
jgi:hypothetical protein